MQNSKIKMTSKNVKNIFLFINIDYFNKILFEFFSACPVAKLYGVILHFDF
jgi:hypothetical protein